MVESGGELVDLGLPEWMTGVLAARGVRTADEARAFLRPSLDQLHDPGAIPGIETALDRLEKAREEGETVVVVGDYDVDGVSATALLVAVFRACGLATEPILPRRLEEGYGFQPAHVERALLLGASLIVTADCGSTAVPGARAAMDAGVDLIVTDHHLSDRHLPDGVVEINLKRRSGEYPEDDLCGAGIAFKLAQAFAARRGRKIDPTALLRIAALGTVCDMVPLLGENRTIAALGLRALPDTPSPGLKALIRRSGVKAPVTASDIGFKLGPRINAAGRVATAEPALELLLTRDPKVAAEQALQLDEWNRQRRAIEARVYEEAVETFESRSPTPPLFLAWSPDWHRGVVGIAAGKIARTFRRPTILLSVDGDNATGSGRSLSGIHLYDFLSDWRGDLVRFGGHAQAVGLTAAVADLERLRDTWEEHAEENWDKSLFRRRYAYDLDLPAESVDADLLAELDRLEPYGEGNRQPLLKVGPLRLAGPPRLFRKADLSATARGDGDGTVGLLGWGWRPRLDDLSGRFEALGFLELDRYTGQPVLRLVDARPFSDESTEAPREAPADDRT